MDPLADKIASHFKIVDKNANVVPFHLNAIQRRYLASRSNRDIILKARQQGFSSLILALFTWDFLFEPNSSSVVIADIADNAVTLLSRVKFYLQSFEEKTGLKVPLQYNSKYELVNSGLNSRYSIGTAENTKFGRSQTITNLHLSEAAFYPHLQGILSGAAQAVVPSGHITIETTANGFNEFKEFWDRSSRGETGYQALFYPASDFYEAGLLQGKKQELGALFMQEYPQTPVEAFLSSGNKYFDSMSLSRYLEETSQGVMVGEK